MEQSKEFAKQHPDFPSYLITKVGGRVFSKKTEKELSRSKDPRGYLYVDLYEGGRRTKMRIHILVCEAFQRKRVKGSEVVDHKDGNKLNCDNSNLEIVTYSVNTIRAYELGLVGGKKRRYKIR